MLFFLKRKLLTLCHNFAPWISKFCHFCGYTLVKMKSPDINTPPPPNIPPDHLFNDFTMNNTIPVLYVYSNEKYNSKNDIPHNTKKVYRKTIQKLDNRSFKYYGNEIKAFYDALYKYPLNNKNVIVFGLTGCNCDAISIWNNAKKVYVVDYNKPVCEHEKVEVLTLSEIGEVGGKADAAFAYSSFEHDGLGRYGDPLDQYGDLRAMEETHSLLVGGGILFLGVPLGLDTLVWNLHRIYGKLRLPLLLKGWQCLDVYNTYTGKSAFYPFDLPPLDAIQCILVLRKINEPYPNDLTLSDKNILDTFDYPFTTYSPKILHRINRIILDYKHNQPSISNNNV